MAGYLDNCGFVAASAGTVDFVVSSALPGGYQLPSAAGVVNGSPYYYRAYSSDQTQWEIGLCAAFSTAGGGTFPRPTAVLFNSLGTTAKINFSNPPNVVVGVLLAEGLAMYNAAFVAYRFKYAGSSTFSGADLNGLTLQYTVGAVLGMRNGRMMTPGLDFTATNGSSITVNIPLATDDEIDFIAFTTALASSYNTIQQWTKTAAVSQTVFNGLDNSGLITLATNGYATQVFTSTGGLLTPGVDYTLTSTAITLAVGISSPVTLTSVTINTNNLTGVTQPQGDNSTIAATTAYADLAAGIQGTGTGDTAQSIGSSVRFAYTTAAFTAPRVWTLPAANSLPKGATLVVADVAGGVTQTNTLSVARAGSDTIDNGTPSFVINIPNGFVSLRTDGVSKWQIVAGANSSAYINSLGSNVSLNNTASYFDGPSVSQGTAGTWLVTATATFYDSGGSGANFYFKLWDGTTVIASTGQNTNPGSVNTVTLSGFISNPAGNLRLSARDTTASTGVLLSNQTGNGKDCTITAVRIG